MTSYETIAVDTGSAVQWIRLSRPAQMNAITPRMVDELERALSQVAADGRAQALLLTGSGKAFSAGADLGELPGAQLSRIDPAGLRDFLTRMKAVCDLIEDFPVPTIAVVNGLACAGGLELLLCCDFVVASEAARIGDLHANFGLLPGAGASVRLPRRIGMAAAKLLMYTGELWSAAEMHRLGLVQRIFAADALEAGAASLALTIAAKSPLATRRTRALLRDGLRLQQQDALMNEIEALAQHAGSDDMGEGLKAFAEKRQPAFTGA